MRPRADNAINPLREGDKHKALEPVIWLAAQGHFTVARQRPNQTELTGTSNKRRTITFLAERVK